MLQGRGWPRQIFRTADFFQAEHCSQEASPCTCVHGVDFPKHLQGDSPRAASQTPKQDTALPPVPQHTYTCMLPSVPQHMHTHTNTTLYPPTYTHATLCPPACAYTHTQTLPSVQHTHNPVCPNTCIHTNTTLYPTHTHTLPSVSQHTHYPLKFSRGERTHTRACTHTHTLLLQF